jgi:hypothetical protein
MAERFRIPWTTGKFEVSQPESTIAPPPEPSDTQVGEWLIDDGYPWDPQEEAVITITASRLKNVACQAAQWGADQELEACCELLQQKGIPAWTLLRLHRRPKPPSLKEQALAELAEWENVMDIAPDSPIRRALEQLDD